MDATHLKETYPHLISYMEENGYSKGYVKSITTEIRRVISLDGDKSVNSYEELFRSMGPANGYMMSSSALRARRNRLGVVMAFDTYGVLPDRRSRSGFMKNDSYSYLNDHYRTLVENYRRYANKHGKCRDTISIESANASCFFRHLQECGAETILEATGSQVADFFMDGNGTKRGHSYRKNIKAVLVGNQDTEFENACSDVIELLPSTRPARKNFPYMKDDEADTLRKAVTEDSLTHTIRDRLIVALALFYGMRGSDIQRFSYDWIDWENDTITFNQSKTGGRLTLPLLPIIGNLAVDMVRENPGRKGKVPMISSGHRPDEPLEKRSVCGVVSKFMKSSGIRTTGSLAGVRMLRHHAATTMLRSGVKSPVISSVLGHSSPESVAPYIDGSIEDLRTCGLDISQYQIPDDLFML